MPTISKKIFRIKKRKHKDPNFEPQKFYNSTIWRKAAKRHRKKQPLCEVGLLYGRLDPAECVDHVISIFHGGAKLDPANFQSLTREVHAMKTRGEEQGQIYKSIENDEGDLIPERDEYGQLIPIKNVQGVTT